MDYFISLLRQMQIDSLETPALLLFLVIPVLYVLSSFVMSGSEMKRIQVPSVRYRETVEKTKPCIDAKKLCLQWKWLKKI